MSKSKLDQLNEAIAKAKPLLARQKNGTRMGIINGKRVRLSRPMKAYSGRKFSIENAPQPGRAIQLRETTYSLPSPSRGGESFRNFQRSHIKGALGRLKAQPHPSTRAPGGGPVNRKRVKKAAEELHKAKAKTLYVYRPVENAEDILAWARGAGFKSLLPAEKLHCTIIASAIELNWAALFDDYHVEPNEERKSMCDCGPVYRFEDRTKTKTIEGGVREVKKLGDKGAVVLAFESLSLTSRWLDLRRAGAVSKFPSFVPHLTLTLSGDVPKDIQPYNGPIILGEECWEEFKDGAYANVEEVVTKAALDDLQARLAALETAQSKPASEAA
ncbi:MAG: hypothetical protein KJZ75_11235 [Hyphomonadaceae bacterium]|nr:hypothetical protein [Hyphomonadaceae bacterium]